MLIISLEEKDSPLAEQYGIQDCFIVIQNRCVQATEELSRLVTETARQQPATQKDFRTQELAINIQTLLFKLGKFQAIGSLQEEIAKMFRRFQILEEGAKLYSASQNAI